MKYLALIIMALLLSACHQTKEEIVASKCRLNLPINTAECEAVGVYGKQGGRMKGLPASGIDVSENKD